MPSNRAVIGVALLAAIAGGLASLYFEPTLVYRLAGTEVGQRAIQTTLRAQAKTPPDGIEIATPGKVIPNMALRGLNDAMVQLPSAWQGHTTLVNFWATWCAPCLKEMPDLQAFANQQTAHGVHIVGIALDEPENVRTFLAEHGITYSILLDSAGPADSSVRLGNPAGVLPYTVLISADGRLLKSRVGPFTAAAEIAQWVQPSG